MTSFQNARLSLLLLLVLTSSQAAFALTMVYQSDVAIEPFKSEFFGSYIGGQFGASLASGDFNNDGIDDIAVGAPFSSTAKQKWNGSVKVLFGGDAGGEIEIEGNSAGDQFGTSLAFADLNSDGIDDLIIGAYNALVYERRPGKAYVYYGRIDEESTEGNALAIADNPGESGQMGSQVSTRLSSHWLGEFSADYAFVGISDKSGFGISLTTGDVNNDGIDDLLVGSPFSKGTGLVYGFFGSKDVHFENARSISLADIIFHGEVPNERFGSSITSGDLNGDGVTDVVVGGYWANMDGDAQVGKVYLYDGTKDFERVVNLTKATAILKGKGQNQWFGFDLDIKELNGDEYDDLVVSSFPYKGEREKASVMGYYGSADFDIEHDFVINGVNGEALTGASLLLDDFDGDGLNDLVVGAPGVSGSKSSYEGDVYAFYNQGDGFKANYRVDNNEFGSVIRGENADDWFGYSIESADFNGDGLRDLIVGSRYADGVDGVNHGKVFVLYGQSKRFGKARAVLNTEESEVNRGELLNVVLGSFDIREKKSKYIQECNEYLEFCLFNFMAMSSYDDIAVEGPIQLYPDVSPEHQYSNDINLATKLGLVNGYLYDEDSPFYPERPVTRIQALKIIFGAADLVPPKFKFELVALLGSYADLLSQMSSFEDIDSTLSYMWWYPRYVNFAVENGIVDEGDYFRPSDNITVEELSDIISRTANYVKTTDEETESPEDSKVETFGGGGEEEGT